MHSSLLMGGLWHKITKILYCILFYSIQFNIYIMYIISKLFRNQAVSNNCRSCKTIHQCSLYDQGSIIVAIITAIAQILQCGHRQKLIHVQLFSVLKTFSRSKQQYDKINCLITRLSDNGFKVDLRLSGREFQICISLLGKV